MSPDDLPEVRAIEVRCFTTPWPVSSFKYELKSRQAILKVAVLNGRIVGYVCIRTILEITHILNLAVLPSFRRKGIGSMLLCDALQGLKLCRPDKESLTLEVRESNTAAIKLYEKFKFKIIGRRVGYYNKPHEDAVIMGLETGRRPHYE